jgi:hypothetical protein
VKLSPTGVRTLRLFIAAICLTIATSASALADDPYIVRNVRIDATADDAVAAQTLAMAEGQTIAAQMLIERLTLAEDRVETMFDFEPRMNEFGEMVVENAMDQAIAAEMISGLEISNEQRSSTRYIAELVVRFDPRVVERVLGNRGIAFVESPSRPMLVLPVFDDAGSFLLWQGNPWLDAWSEQSFAHSLTPMFLADNAASQQAISPRGALGLDEASLRQLASINNVNRIAILRAQERDEIRRFGGYLISFDAEDAMVVETWGPETVFGGWSDAARMFVTSLEDSWKRNSIVRDGEVVEVMVTVLYGALPEWERLQSTLTGASLVRDARLEAVSRDGALMTLAYRGEMTQLISELAERGAALEEHPGLGWVVRSSF